VPILFGYRFGNILSWSTIGFNVQTAHTKQSGGGDEDNHTDRHVNCLRGPSGALQCTGNSRRDNGTDPTKSNSPARPSRTHCIREKLRTQNGPYGATTIGNKAGNK